MIYHGINYIPQPKDKLLVTAQKLAIDSINQFKDDQVKLCSLTFTDEQGIDNSDLDLKLNRDSSNITNRRLPFVKDLFAMMALEASEEDWIGFTNSDIVIKNRKFYSILKEDEIHESVLFNRVEIENVPLTDNLNTFLSYTGQRNPYSGRDGFFIKKRLWDQIEPVLPDYIIAEPYWDIGLIALLEKHNISIIHDEIYHYFHPRRWQRETPGALYNKNLYDQQIDAG